MLYLNRYETKQILGKGSFGCIYKGIDQKTGKNIAIKVDTDKPASFDQLKWEYTVYKEMSGTVINEKCNWPQAYYFGKQVSGDAVLVMDLLGDNLDIAIKKQSSSLDASQIAFFATQMLKLLEIFHSKGFIHRDLKPQNFVTKDIGDSKNKYPELLLIDYGLVKKYWDKKSSTHSPYLSKKGLKGTVRYTSSATHLGLDQSRRDDLQSLGYILVFMTVNRLPWQSVVKSANKQASYKEIMNLKLKTKLEELIVGVPEQLEGPLLNYLMYTNSLMFHETPDYKFMLDLFNLKGDNGFHAPLEQKTKSKQ